MTFSTYKVEKNESDSSQNKLLKIGDIAAQADVSVPTIRYYKTLGLLKPMLRSKSGYRYYNHKALKRLNFIKKAQFLQFPLAEIQQVLGVRSQGSPACFLVRKLLDQEISLLEEQISQMKVFKAELEVYRVRWVDRALDAPSIQEVCSLIEEVAYKDMPIHNLSGDL